MEKQDPYRIPWAGRDDPTPRGGADRSWVAELPDLQVEQSSTEQLHRALTGAHIELALPLGGAAIHEGLVQLLREVVECREGLVWQEGDRLMLSFGSFGHHERPVVEALGECLARGLNATVVFATTVGIVVSAKADFLN